MPSLGWEVPLGPLCTMNGESLCLHNSTPLPGALESSHPTPTSPPHLFPFARERAEPQGHEVTRWELPSVDYRS